MTTDELIAKLRADRLKYKGLPQESALQIIEEAIGKLLLLPESQKVEENGIALADSAVNYLALTFIPPPFSLVGAPLATKGADLLFHGLITWLEDKYKAEAALTEGS